jgi:hypothetical protein
MRKVLFATLFGLALVLPAGSAIKSADTAKPTRPINLAMNTAGDEDEPHVADGGLTLYYAREQKGDSALFAARRRSALQVWPKKGDEVEDYIKNKGAIRSVYATQGRYPHYLYFAAKDTEGKNYDLFVAVRQGPGKAWSAPTAVANVNTDADELHPWLTSDGKSLYFSRKTADGWRVFVSTRTGATGPGGWREPREVDLPVGFHHATLTPNGKTMYLQGPLEKGRWGLFTSNRTSKGWSKPEPLEALNDPEGKKGDRSPNLSRDGRLLYFASDRPGGKGGLDLWVVPTEALTKKK